MLFWLCPLQSGGRGPIAFLDLHNNIQEIKTKAAQSESIIQQIQRDREKSDYAKGRLLDCSDAVNQLSSLTKALNQLEFEVQNITYYVHSFIHSFIHSLIFAIILIYYVFCLFVVDW
jgi:hypothetical protein